MFSNLISTTALLSLVILIADVSSVSASTVHHVPRIRHHQLTNRPASKALADDTPKKIRRRKTCGRPHTVTPTKTVADEGTTTIVSSTKSAPKPTKNTSSGGGGGNGIKPPGWPMLTQAGAAPAATRTSAADPFLMELSKSYNNADNPLYNKVHKGIMTYYGQGLGACGDTYDDNSFTAAVSKLMYDSWPGAMAGEMNRNPICGPFVPGRKTINQAGRFVTSVKGASFVNVGGDGLLNCDLKSQCHIPLTATVKHGGKSIVVKIVDRCEACAIGDIDLTPTAFAALADMSLGRTDVEWFFNKY